MGWLVGSIPAVRTSGNQRAVDSDSDSESFTTGGMMTSGRPRYKYGIKVQEVPRKAPLAPRYQDLTSGINLPIWFERGLDAPEFPMVTRDHDCDVCVVGGGIAGLTAAYLLSKKVN